MSVLYNLNKNLGISLFNNPNNLNYNLFNFFFKKNISNYKNSKLLEKYHIDGFLKTDINSNELVDFLSKEVENQNPKNNEKNHIFFEINSEMQKKIKEHINYKFGAMLKEFENYYRNKIAVINIDLKRNYGLNDLSYYSSRNRTKEKEYYNMYFHCDYYTMNYFKLFINLHDITEEYGPLSFYNIQDTKNFVKKANYKSRNEYNNIELPGIIKNCGKKGESLFLNTPQCVHRASIPKKGNYRDVLFVTFAATPDKIGDLFHYEKDYSDSIWKRDKTLSKMLAKPKNMRKTFQLYRNLAKKN